MLGITAVARSRLALEARSGLVWWQDDCLSCPNEERTLGSRPMQKYLGSCHCGAVKFEIETDFPELTMCDCSMCRRRNALMVKVHESRFRLIAGEEALTEYQFHTRTARHYFCKVCGIYPFHRKRVTPDHFGVNVHCLEGFSVEGIPLRQAVGAAMP